jgi:DNA-binding NarL/FixJ family response regulator
VRLAKFVKFREEKFGGVLFETRSEKVYTLTPTAAAVVQEIQAGCQATEIAPRLEQRFQSSDGTIAREVSAFLDELRAKGLVEG